jgi:hypothetical protein
MQKASDSESAAFMMTDGSSVHLIIVEPGMTPVILI